MTTPTPKTTQSKRNPLTAISLTGWVAIVITVVAVVFILQNRTSVSIELFWVSVRSPMWFILLVIFAVGWLAGALTVIGVNRRRAKAPSA
ncbi:LapA family protein [Gordonia terrae]|uniref:LapA family protein n=1 Tax=Gordonia terrae TaxID=2055 RepID=UPI00200B82D7|nr:LapA family protein [Gordonia terrae]UPW07271.1 LapA family protein [Gordonia terrae]